MLFAGDDRLFEFRLGRECASRNTGASDLVKRKALLHHRRRN
jgi:hypothetical protein